MASQESKQGEALILRPSLTLLALQAAAVTVAPGRVLEFYVKTLETFIRAGDEGRAAPIHMFCREWAVIVEVDRYSETAGRLRTAEEALKNGDVQVREAAIREVGDTVRAAHKAVASAPPAGPDGPTENHGTVASVNAGTLTVALRNEPDQRRLPAFLDELEDQLGSVDETKVAMYAELFARTASPGHDTERAFLVAEAERLGPSKADPAEVKRSVRYRPPEEPGRLSAADGCEEAGCTDHGLHEARGKPVRHLSMPGTLAFPV